jgi:hypothetical protein
LPSAYLSGSLRSVTQLEGVLVWYDSDNTPLNLTNNKMMSPIPRKSIHPGRSDDKVITCVDQTIRFQYYAFNTYPCTKMLLSKEQTKSSPLLSFFNHVATSISGILNSIKDGSSDASGKEEL